MDSNMTKAFYVLALACALVLGAAPTAGAALVVVGSSRALDFQGTQTDNTVSPPAIVESGPEYEVSGTAPVPYALSESIIGDPGDPSGSVSATSDVDGGSGVRFARATYDGPDARVNADVDIEIDNEDLEFELEITGITVTADVSGDAGALLETGGVTYDSITATLNGTDLSPSTTPAPNTVLIDEAIGGIFELTATFNAQTIGGDGDVERSIQVAGVVFEVRVFENGVLQSSEVSTFGFAEASLTAVPEPASLALLGLGGLYMVGRRRGRSAADHPVTAQSIVLLTLFQREIGE